jgi:hypothetical protein
MGRTRLFSALAIAAGLTLAACSDGGSPTETTAPAGTAGSGIAFSVASDSAHARHDALKQALEDWKAQALATKAANRQDLADARREWKAWKEDWKEQYAAASRAWKREHKGEKGGPDIELLRCEPRDYSSDAAIVGPAGGILHAGNHELVIPKGALDHEELITMEAATSSLVDVRFEPHGLQFQQPAELKLSYKGCVRPTSADLLVAYLGQGNQVLELPPSVDVKSGDEVDADIDHFSRYAIAY